MNEENPITDLVSTFDGIPLPPAIKKSFFSAIGKLVTGLADIPAAMLNAKADEIRTKSEADRIVTINAAKAAALKFTKDDALIERSVLYFGKKIISEQANREKVAKAAVDDLIKNLPENDTNESIDEDWLNHFENIASNKSNEEMQKCLGRILSGEIRKPGSFSPATINALSLINQPVANIYQHFCSHTISTQRFAFLIYNHIPNYLINGIPQIRLPYYNLCALQSYNLLNQSLSSIYDSKVLLIEPFDFAGNKYVLRRKHNLEEKQIPQLNISLLSPIGFELRGIIDLNPSPFYENELRKWFNSFNYELEKVN